MRVSALVVRQIAAGSVVLAAVAAMIYLIVSSMKAKKSSKTNDNIKSTTSSNVLLPVFMVVISLVGCMILKQKFADDTQFSYFDFSVIYLTVAAFAWAELLFFVLVSSKLPEQMIKSSVQSVVNIDSNVSTWFGKLAAVAGGSQALSTANKSIQSNNLKAMRSQSVFYVAVACTVLFVAFFVIDLIPSVQSEYDSPGMLSKLGVMGTVMLTFIPEIIIYFSVVRNFKFYSDSVLAAHASESLETATSKQLVATWNTQDNKVKDKLPKYLLPYLQNLEGSCSGTYTVPPIPTIGQLVKQNIPLVILTTLSTLAALYALFCLYRRGHTFVVACTILTALLMLFLQIQFIQFAEGSQVQNLLDNQYSDALKYYLIPSP